MAKLNFLSPKHAVKRVEDGGKAYEEMLDLVMNHVHALCKSNADNLVPAMSQSEEMQRKYVDDILRLDAKNYKNAADYVATHYYFFVCRPTSPIALGKPGGPDKDDKTAWYQQEQKLKDKLIECLASRISGPDGWTHDTINQAIAEVQEYFIAEPAAAIPQNLGDRFVQNWVWGYVRAYMCFGERGPSVADAMAILGGDVVLDRIRNIEVTRGPKLLDTSK